MQILEFVRLKDSVLSDVQRAKKQYFYSWEEVRFLCSKVGAGKFCIDVPFSSPSLVFRARRGMMDFDGLIVALLALMW